SVSRRLFLAFGLLGFTLLGFAALFFSFLLAFLDDFRLCRGSTSFRSHRFWSRRSLFLHRGNVGHRLIFVGNEFQGAPVRQIAYRSEERRVGKDWRSRCGREQSQ